jgi:hypothetical protein
VEAIMVVQTQSRQRQLGVALPLVLMVSAVVLLLAVGMLRLSVGDLTFTTANRSRTRVFYAAEMGLARALDKLRTDYYGGVSNLQPNIIYWGMVKDDTGNTPQEKALPDETFNAVNASYEATLNTADGNFRVRYRLQEAPWLLTSPDATRVYTVEAVARDLTKGTWAGLRTTLTAQRTMLWYYGVFFADDIEFGNAATLSFVGPVHTNKNLMLSSASSTNLTFDSFLTSAGRIYRGDPFFASNMGTVRIKNAAGTYVDMTTANDGIKELSGFSTSDLANPAKGDGLPSPADTWKQDPAWKQGALDTWNGKVRDKAQGVQVEAPPPVQSIDRGGYYETKAGLKIITNAGGVTQITKQDGTVINPATLGDNNPISTSTFWNGREKKSVTVTNIDVQKLTAAGLYPSNGLVYASREDARADANPLDTTADTSRVPNGIRLTNAAVLPGPMTMVTNDPLYIKGDFNVHVDAAGKKPGQSGGDHGRCDDHPVGWLLRRRQRRGQQQGGLGEHGGEHGSDQWLPQQQQRRRLVGRHAQLPPAAGELVR